MTVTADLRAVTNSIATYSNDLADTVERNFDQAARSVRLAVHTTPWIPTSIKATLPPLPPPSQQPHSTSFPLSYLAWLHDWVNQHHGLTAAAVAFVGTSTFFAWRQRRRWVRRTRRRACRAANGAKTELVVLAGSPFSPLVRALAVELERKGFLVYVPVSSMEEEGAVAEWRVADVHALSFDLASVGIPFSG